VEHTKPRSCTSVALGHEQARQAGSASNQNVSEYIMLQTIPTPSRWKKQRGGNRNTELPMKSLINLNEDHVIYLALGNLSNLPYYRRAEWTTVWAM